MLHLKKINKEKQTKLTVHRKKRDNKKITAETNEIETRKYKIATKLSFSK